MRSYLPNRKPERTQALVAILAIGVLSFTVFFWGDLARGAARTGATVLWSSYASAVQAVGNSKLLTNEASLIADNARLQEEVKNAQWSIVVNDVLKTENAALRELLRMQTATSSGIGARVVSNPAHSPYGTIVVAFAPGSEVHSDDVVLVGERIAIGSVVEVHESTALVQLFTAPGVKTTVDIPGAANLEMVGRGSNNAEILVPRALAANIGQTVLLADTYATVGTIAAITEDSAEPTKKVLIGLPFAIQSINVVLLTPRL